MACECLVSTALPVVYEPGRGSILSSAHSPPPSPAEPLYLPHLAHGANGNQPFSGEQKRKRDRKRKIGDACAVAVFDGGLRGVWEKEGSRLALEWTVVKGTKGVREVLDEKSVAEKSQSRMQKQVEGVNSNER